jgi:hypothetical protein
LFGIGKGLAFVLGEIIKIALFQFLTGFIDKI